MSMPVEAVTSHEWRAAPRADANTQRRLAERIRGEFLEMPGLKLTQAQAARVFGLDARQSRVLDELVDEGFLVRDGRGTLRCRDSSPERD